MLGIRHFTEIDQQNTITHPPAKWINPTQCVHNCKMLGVQFCTKIMHSYYFCVFWVSSIQISCIHMWSCHNVLQIYIIDYWMFLHFWFTYKYVLNDLCYCIGHQFKSFIIKSITWGRTTFAWINICLFENK